METCADSAGADKAASRDKGSIMTRAPSVSDFEDDFVPSVVVVPRNSRRS